MDQIQGKIIRLRIYMEEGRTDWLLALSKVIWFLIWILFPFSLFRFLYDLLGAVEAVLGIFILLIILRIAGPQNLVMLDELLGRIAPSLRSAIRFGSVRVFDFRLINSAGQEIACILRGDLLGSAPMTGDQVELEGRMRQGTFVISRGRNLTTGSVLAPRPSRSLWILLVTLGIASLFSLYLLGVFDAWIYDWFISIIDMLSGEKQA
jgi:hypothetical protein